METEATTWGLLPAAPQSPSPLPTPLPLSNNEQQLVVCAGTC